MAATQLACTTYTLREYTRTPATIARTLARVKEIGYSAVQFWEAIITAGKASGVQWYIVEQDNCYGQSPFDCIERSLKNLKAMGLS